MSIRTEGLRRAVNYARDAARKPIDGMIVVTLRDSTDGSGATCNGVAFGSPAQVVAAATYLLHRVRVDAQLHVGAVVKLDQAIALLGEAVPRTIQ